MLQFWHLHIHTPIERRRFRSNIAFNSFLLYYFYYFRHLYNKILPFLLYSYKENNTLFIFMFSIESSVNPFDSMRFDAIECGNFFYFLLFFFFFRSFQFIINCVSLLIYFWQQYFRRWPFVRFVCTGELELTIDNKWSLRLRISGEIKRKQLKQFQNIYFQTVERVVLSI